MDQKDVIQAFCEIAAKVGKARYGSTIPYDCFCGKKSPYFQFHPEIIAFIRNAVDTAIDTKG